jgi:gluconolactonase
LNAGDILLLCIFKFFAMKKFLIAVTIVLAACSSRKEIGTIERLDPALDTIVSPDAIVEILGEGFEWSEGPLWLASENKLIFSDVPKNVIHQWTEEGGVSVYLTPSGLTNPNEKGEGSNGLLLDDEGNLIICQHGDRRLAIMNTTLDAPKADFTTLADNYQGKRFNSPNDAVFNQYDFYFTDPPYGFDQDDEDPKKELPFNGVYVAKAEGDVILLIDSLTRPNGLAFLPDGKILIVANSDAQRARWYRFEIEQDSVVRASVFYDATREAQTENGLPDGLKIDRNGVIYATGPGGVWIFNDHGKLLGKIKVDVSAANCALSDDEKTLYITADMYLLRVKLRK